jgi:hypothetical protein
VSDIDTAAADGLKVLDPTRPIREADMFGLKPNVRFVPKGLMHRSKKARSFDHLQEQISPAVWDEAQNDRL